MKIREDFHRLLDEIKDEEVLKSYYRLIQRLNQNQTGELWNSLTAEEREELMLSYEESFDAKNLISHSVVKEQHEKWLKR